MKALLLLIFLFSFLLASDFKRNNSSKVVIDTKNRLMWIDDISVIKTKLNHKEALNYCEKLNHSGYTNWRLPEIEEFILIVDKRNERTYINKKFKFNVPDGYWANKAHWRTFWFYADYMYFISGTPYFDSRHKKKYVRCVRSI